MRPFPSGQSYVLSLRISRVCRCSVLVIPHERLEVDAHFHSPGSLSEYVLGVVQKM